MKWLKRSKLLFSIFLLLYFLTTGGLVRAEEITLKEAINTGLIDNPTLQELEDNIKQLDRNLSTLKAQLDWQVDLTGNLSKGEVNDSSPLSTNEENLDQLEMGIKGKRSFSSGFSINPTLTFSEEEPYDFDNPNDKFNLSLGISYPLYPGIPTELEQKYYSTYNDLLKARDKLNWQQENKLIDFIQGYLELIRLEENLELALENRKLAEDNLHLVQEQYKIGEAGERQVLTGKISLKETEIKVNEAENNFEQQKKSWYQELGLNSETTIIFSEADNYLQELKKSIDLQEIDLNQAESLIKEARASDIDLKANLLDQKLTMEDLEWSKLSDKPEFKISGDYQYPEEDWNLGIDVSYSLYDGGQKQLKQEDYQAKIDSLEREYQNILDNLQLQLADFLNKLAIARDNLEKQQLNLEKSKLELKLAEEQYSAGLIDRFELEKNQLIAKQAEVELAAAADQVLTSKLQLFKFLGLNLVNNK